MTAKPKKPAKKPAPIKTKVAAKPQPVGVHDQHKNPQGAGGRLRREIFASAKTFDSGELEYLGGIIQ